MNAAIFCVQNKIVTLAPGGAEQILRNLPKGSRVIDAERAPSGHMMIPVDWWHAESANERHMALLTDLPREEEGAS